ncbi:MAG: hypothetical protein ABJC12_02050 [Saprospiraceae bacterium]
MDNTNPYTYLPGACNIGQIEVRRRFRNGYIGCALMICCILIIEYFQVASVFKLIIFLPAFYAVSGFVQAYSKFCYVFGFKGVSSLTGIRVFKKIKEDEFLRKDFNRAIKLISISTIGGAALTAIYFFI